ncbi:MAG: amidohydrolase [Betaproteobacteria bacterium RIFCSPLOWO2_12_FULL_65_14]|nr:MAG: amidohydrolase [Betaproteobacteria bacterium RIFCSPLOWO2_12_FULL_65_14]
MIIDCHTHVNLYEDESAEALPLCLDRLQLALRRNRVDQALILTSYKVSPGRPAARAVVEATRHLPHLHVIAGISWTTFCQADVDELRDLLQAGAIKGLKLYPGYEPFYPADPKLAPAYRLAEEFDVPVMIHTGDTYAPTGKVKYSHPLHVDEVAVDFPKVKFLICHLGNPWFRDCMEVVYKNDNVYTDISGLTLGEFTDRFEAYMSQQLKEMILWGVNPNKVLYGTDWPLAPMESYRQFMEELKLPPRDKDLMFYENAAALFKIEVRPAPMAFGSFFKRI